MTTEEREAMVRDGAVSVEDASDITGLRRAYLYELMADGTIASCKIGRRRLIPRVELRRLLANALTPAINPTTVPTLQAV